VPVPLPLRRFEKDPQALAELLRTGQVHRALLPAPSSLLPTGVAPLDAALGGGLVRGHLHEIVAPASAGGTALLRAALGAATRSGELCALIDPADSFDPAHGGIDLRRLLWVRPRDPLQALRAAEIALEARFALVAVDLGGIARPPCKAPSGEVRVVRFEPRKQTSPGGSPWARLARRAEKHGGALLLLVREPQAGAFALATVELERGPSLWEGRPGAPGRFLRGGSAVGAVARHKRLAPSGPIPLSLPVG
jgi:hypothetical protein